LETAVALSDEVPNGALRVVVTLKNLPAHTRSGPRAGKLGQALPAILVPIAVVFGALERAWLLVHLPLFGDEAIVGLMARQMKAGHFSTFYWGQHYGGVEPYLAVPILALINGGPMGLNATAMVLSAIAAVLVGAIVVESTGNRRSGALAGAVTWVWPYALLWNSVRELGFRYATLCFGLGLLLCALRFQRGRRGPFTCLLLGLTLGAGWWASPEILYFVVPAAVLLLASARTGRAWTAHQPARWHRRPSVLIIMGAVVGALPWLYTNAATGFLSLRAGSLPASSHLSYVKRLSVFFHKVLPMQLGVKTVLGGAWVGGPFVGRLLLAAFVVLMVAATARALWAFAQSRTGVRLLAPAIGLFVFPFLFAANPGAGYWMDGRYGIYLGPMVAVLLFGAFTPRSVGTLGARHRPEPRRMLPRMVIREVSSAAGAIALVGAFLLTASDAKATEGTPATSVIAFFQGWHDPNAAMRNAIGDMEPAGIRFAYGDYWTSYDLDFLAPGRVEVSPSPLDIVRWPAVARAVSKSVRPAWLFFAPRRLGEASEVFSNPEPGPGGFTEQTFEAFLRRSGIGYRVVHLGVLDAVVPARHVKV
jgi:hypothetical protein